MIEREFVSEKIKHLKIKEMINSKIRNYAGVGDVTIEKTPLGEKIIIHAVRPSLVIGRAGQTIKDITTAVKLQFGLENPQVEVKEITNPFLDAAVVAKRIVADFERFGTKRFKVVGYRALQNIMNAGAMGVEIRITGRGIPGSRAKSWRFYDGYLKKCGDVALSQVDKAFEAANLKAGTVGVKVYIMPANAKLPDKVKVQSAPKVEEIIEKDAEKEIKEIKIVNKAPKAEPEVKAKEVTINKVDDTMKRPISVTQPTVLDKKAPAKKAEAKSKIKAASKKPAKKEEVAAKKPKIKEKPKKEDKLEEASK